MARLDAPASSAPSMCERQAESCEDRGSAPAAHAVPPPFACESLPVESCAWAPQPSPPAYPPPACHPTFHVARCMLHTLLALLLAGGRAAASRAWRVGRPSSEAAEAAGIALLPAGPRRGPPLLWASSSLHGFCPAVLPRRLFASSSMAAGAGRALAARGPKFSNVRSPADLDLHA
jgi:hypothetical protein